MLLMYIETCMYNYVIPKCKSYFGLPAGRGGAGGGRKDLLIWSDCEDVVCSGKLPRVLKGSV